MPETNAWILKGSSRQWGSRCVGSGNVVVPHPLRAERGREFSGLRSSARLYFSGTNLIELCPANVHRADQDLELMLRREMVHAIQENFDWKQPVIPEPWLTWLVRWTTVR